MVSSFFLARFINLSRDLKNFRLRELRFGGYHTRMADIPVVESATRTRVRDRSGSGKGIIRRFNKEWQLWVIVSLPLAWLVIFRYIPMYGAQIAFKDFSIVQGIIGSPWAGLKYFRRFVESYQFTRIIGNTIGLSLYHLFAGFPLPILLAIALNEAGNRTYKKTVQMITYAPHFISTVVVVAIIMQFLDPRIGMIPRVILSMGIDPGNIMGKAEYFKTIYVLSDLWQHTGYGSIIYLAALSSIDPTLHEAAIVDGASRMQRIVHIDFPGILPTAVILLILRAGRIMNVGFEKVYLLQNPLNMRKSEVIATYVYKVGLIQADFSFSAAVGLFNAVINMALLLLVNRIARKLGETSLW
jgi:putative aldouronate transport system permease protein